MDKTGVMRGTTPTIVITTAIDLTQADKLFVTFKQDGKTIFEKTLEDVVITSRLILVELDQTDTLSLRDDRTVEFQIRGKVHGKTVGTAPMSTAVLPVYKEGVI